ncbi:WSC domain-containing protein [Aspergillus puulaauensis]|uniref:WSC domain-containing protein n=1 Tax=Aspergillus puulaauensis TaxID=1220207 RepID=A0A7R7XFU9_9EURO|nr:uncharacterized protein APUU_20941A [Aspergillus puulaauensis]BCS20509.1 hypothetical protein APUU_20941A [Aspergillus puulaauensis]
MLLKYTIALLASTAAATHTLRYLGCYLDSSDLDNIGQSPFQSVGLCKMNCMRRGDTIMGVRNGTECWCGLNYPNWQDELDPRACNLPCGGYPLDICGGHGALSCYEIEQEATVSSLTMAPTILPMLGIGCN